MNNSFEKYIPETARELLNIADNKRNSEVKLTIEELQHQKKINYYIDLELGTHRPK